MHTISAEVKSAFEQEPTQAARLLQNFVNDEDLVTGMLDLTVRDSGRAI